MRFCPKCGDYYADDLLTFCLTDGAPLAGVAPEGRLWEEGLRAVEEKEKVLRVRRRRLRWQRLVQVATTTLVTTMVVCVVAVNGLIYLTPEPDEAPAAAPSRATPKREATPSTVESRLKALIPDSVVTRTEPLPTTETPADPSLKAATTSSGPRERDDDARDDGDATPTPTPTPTADTKFEDRTPTPTPAPTPPPATPTPTPTPVIVSATPPERPPAECSDADRERERDAILGAYGAAWRRRIEGERQKIIAEHKPDGAVEAEAELGELEYQGLFLKACTAAFVTARYTWKVRATARQAVIIVPVPKSKRFACAKLGGAWICR